MSLRTNLLLALAISSAAMVRADVKVGETFPAFAPAGVVNLGGGELPVTTGQVVGPPAKRALPTFAVQVKGDEVTIET